MKKIRVLIVEDSPVIRQFLEYIVERDSRLEIAAAVDTAEDALRILHKVSPDVISMDIRLPGMNGLEATERIMRERPTPIVVISASVEKEDLKITMNALRAGALTVLEKPAGGGPDSYQALAERICTQLAIMSQVKVVRRRRHPASPASPLAAPHTPHVSDYRALGIVSSTGGPNALVQVLGRLTSDFPLPVFLVQHIAPTFLQGFAAWLETVCPLPVVIVRDSAPTERSKIYIAAQDFHLRARDGQALACPGEPVSGQRPSGTVLFESMAGTFGPEALGIILTGMGDDGARGLLELRRNGAYTIAEDESTAVVYGMPAEAARLGAVCESLPLPAIAPRIMDLVWTGKEAAKWNSQPRS